MISVCLMAYAALVLSASFALLWRHVKGGELWNLLYSASLMPAFVITVLALIKVNYP